MTWSRRRFLTAGVGAALAPVTWTDTMPQRPSAWLQAAVTLDSRVGELHPLALADRSVRMVTAIEGAIDVAPNRDHRRTLHRAAAIAGGVGAWACRLRGGNPAVYVSRAAHHAVEAGDGVARACALMSALPKGEWMVSTYDKVAVAAEETARRALSSIGAERRAASSRARCYWWLAWVAAVVEDDIGARTAVGLAEKESISAGWPGHAVLGMSGVIRSRAGIPGDVSLLHQAVVDARAARAGADHIDCSLYLAAAQARHGEWDEAATVLAGALAAHDGTWPWGAGRLAVARRTAMLIPPGPWREELDAVLRGRV